MKHGLNVAVLLVALLATGCATIKPPRSFSKVTAPGWASIEIREEVDYDHAWKTVVGILVRDFDLQFVSKDDGYLRTDWLYSWSGVYQPNYRVRVIAKFADDRKTLGVKSEAQALVTDPMSGRPTGTWVMGVDSRLMSTIKTDLMGTIGRTTR